MTMLALSGLLLASCSGQYTPEGGVEREEIGFRSVTEKTRAVQTDEANIADFRVRAVWERGAGDFVPAFMDGVKVERQGQAWTYSPLSYWPAGGEVDFFGYSPAGSKGVRSFSVDGVAYNRVVLEYDATSDNLMQEDFMVASALGKTSSPVLMNFRHMLSQVEFRVRSSAPGVTFRVRSIELHNLDRTGTLTGTVPTAGAGEMQWAWSGNTAATEKRETYAVYLPQPFEAAYPASATEVPAFVSLTNPSVGNMMILPQQVTIGSGQLYTQANIDANQNDQITQGLLHRPKDLSTMFYISVRLDSETYYYPNTGVIPFHDNVTVYIPLYVSLGEDGVVGGGNDEPFEFEAGSKYTFLLELNHLDRVEFTVFKSESESEWITGGVEIPVTGM
jgi:hypothetical protein